MEKLKLDLTTQSAVIKEEDEFYKDIDAPNFVDFTLPDRSPPDDSSWFCVRIGCDQNHEQVDPDALYSSFVLRVMAARSPNVRLRKALGRQNLGSNPKCPHTAPAKPPMSRITRLSTVTSVAETMIKTKIMNHPVSSLRSTPSRTKIRADQDRDAKTALTTPRTKKCLSKRQEPFLSEKHQRQPVVVPRKGTVAKALFVTNTPSKSQAPAPEICHKLRKMNMASLTKNVPSRYLCQLSSATYRKKGDECAPKILKSGQDPARSGNKEILVLDSNFDGKTTKVGIPDDFNQISTAEDSEQPTKEESSAMGIDDNKENISGNRMIGDNKNASLELVQCENKGLRPETCENSAQKVIKMPNKMLQGNFEHRRTTNPKPFRLRTDERGILKEANSDRRRLQLEPNKETQSVYGNGDGALQNRKVCCLKNKQINADKQVQRIQSIKARNEHVTARGTADSKFVPKRLQCKKVGICKENGTEKLQERVVQAATATPNLPTRTGSLRARWNAPTPPSRTEKKTSVTISRVKAAANTGNKIINQRG